MMSQQGLTPVAKSWTSSKTVVNSATRLTGYWLRTGDWQLALCWQSELLTRISFDSLPAVESRLGFAVTWLAEDELSLPCRRLADRIWDYFRGVRVEFDDFVLDLSCTSPFQLDVIEACRRIPYGEVRTYGELAALAGSPRAARAVGNVMRTNRFPIIVPCHRVVRSGGQLGGFSAPDGISLKRRLLELEQSSGGRT